MAPDGDAAGPGGSSGPLLEDSTRSFRSLPQRGVCVHILNAMAIERHVERELEILTAIDEGIPLTQRALAQRLGVALGLTNLYLKRLASKGFIKIREFPTKPYAGKRLRYVLTPKGVGEKARLTYEYMGHSLSLFRRTRDNLRASMGHLAQNGMKRIALYGAGEAAELAYLTLKEFGLEPVDRKSTRLNSSHLGISYAVFCLKKKKKKTKSRCDTRE